MNINIVTEFPAGFKTTKASDFECIYILQYNRICPGEQKFAKYFIHDLRAVCEDCLIWTIDYLLKNEKRNQVN